MARRVSAAAMLAAREVLKEYSLEVRPENAVNGMNNKEGHVAIVIDHATGVYRLAEMRQEHYFWQRRLNANTVTPDQLASYFKKLLEVFDTLPRYKADEQPLLITWQQMPGVALPPHTSPLTKAAVDAARYLLHYYQVTARDGHAITPMDNIRLAMRVDIGLGLEGAWRAEPLARQCLSQLQQNKASKNDIRRCMKELGIRLESLPNFADRQEEMMLLT